MSRVFHFKQFDLTDGRSAMKLSTDAVLLGVFAGVDHASNILDIGTGSGIVALMLAQRSEALITGIDIDHGSLDDARINFENSPWSNRLQILHQSIQDFAKECREKYDVIVSNPPYFKNSQRSPYSSRNLSKHDVGLSLSDLIPLVATLLHEGGTCSFIVPASEYAGFLDTATSMGLFLKRGKNILPKPGREANRVLLELSTARANFPEISALTIRQEDNNFTPEYREYTRDFYLNF